MAMWSSWASESWQAQPEQQQQQQQFHNQQQYWSASAKKRRGCRGSGVNREKSPGGGGGFSFSRTLTDRAWRLESHEGLNQVTQPFNLVAQKNSLRTQTTSTNSFQI